MRSESGQGNGMSWIVAMQIKEGNHWDCTVSEYDSKAKAEASVRLCRQCGYYKIYEVTK